MIKVLLVSLDSVRRDYFDSCGSKFLKEFRRDAVTFTQARSIYHTTFPAHYSMFFGGRLGKCQGRPSIFKLVRMSGYDVASFCNGAILYGYGKSYEHMGLKGEIQPTREVMHAEMGVQNPELTRIKVDLGNMEFYKGAAGEKPTHNQLLERLKEDKNQTLYFLHWWKTHLPYRLDEVGLLDLSGVDIRYEAKAAIKILNTLTAQMDQESFEQHYTDNIRRVLDEEVAPVIEALKEAGDYNQSLIILTADHGEGFFDAKPIRSYAERIELFLRKLRRFRMIYKSPYRQGDFFHGSGDVWSQFVVPLLVKFPTGAAGGERVTMPVNHTMIAPTISRVLEIEEISYASPDLYQFIERRRLTNHGSAKFEESKMQEKTSEEELIEGRLRQLGYLG